jgi:hypothetical protein
MDGKPYYVDCGSAFEKAWRNPPCFKADITGVIKNYSILLEVISRRLSASKNLLNMKPGP